MKETMTDMNEIMEFAKLFPVLIEPGEEGGFDASFPHFDDAIVIGGSTREQAAEKAYLSLAEMFHWDRDWYLATPKPGNWKLFPMAWHQYIGNFHLYLKRDHGRHKWEVWFKAERWHFCEGGDEVSEDIAKQNCMAAYRIAKMELEPEPPRTRCPACGAGYTPCRCPDD